MCVPRVREQERSRDAGLKRGLQVHPVGEGWAGSGPPPSAVCPLASELHLNFGLARGGQDDPALSHPFVWLRTLVGLSGTSCSCAPSRMYPRARVRCVCLGTCIPSAMAGRTGAEVKTGFTLHQAPISRVAWINDLPCRSDGIITLSTSGELWQGLD